MTHLLTHFSFLLHRVVEFASYSDLKNALEKLSGKEINGRKIKLVEAAKKRFVSFFILSGPVCCWRSGYSPLYTRVARLVSNLFLISELI